MQLVQLDILKVLFTIIRHTPFKLHKYKINNNDSQLYIEETAKEKNKNIISKE